MVILIDRLLQSDGWPNLLGWSSFWPLITDLGCKGMHDLRLLHYNSDLDIFRNWDSSSGTPAFGWWHSLFNFFFSTIQLAPQQLWFWFVAGSPHVLFWLGMAFMGLNFLDLSYWNNYGSADISFPCLTLRSQLLQIVSCNGYNWNLWCLPDHPSRDRLTLNIYRKVSCSMQVVAHQHKATNLMLSLQFFYLLLR